MIKIYRDPLLVMENKKLKSEEKNTETAHLYKKEKV